MKPHQLTLTAFGPYVSTVTVDFDRLSPHGLFLLHGPTGAGKTSLLDGLCFALYGRVPGVRNEKRLRSDHAPSNANCQVVLEVSITGRRYRITRSPEQERPKRRGAGMTSEKASVVLEEQRGTSWELVSNRLDEVGEELGQRLGMSVEQFYQVVLLPQGSFAEFLHASSDERAKLLERLFSTRRFRDVEEWLGERRRRTAAEVAQLDQQIAELAARISEQAEQDQPESDLLSWALAISDNAAALELSTQSIAQQANERLAEATSERSRVEELLMSNAAHLAARTALEGLQAQQPSIDALAAELKAAASAAPLASVIDAASLAQADITAAIGARADGEQRDLPTLRAELSTSTKRIGELTALMPLAEQAEVQRAAVTLADGERLRATQTIHELEQSLTAATSDVLAAAATLTSSARAAELAAEQARSAELDVRARRRAGLGAELAATLVTDEECPVCGSVTHPHPAQPTADPANADDEESAASAAQLAIAQAAQAQERAANAATVANGLKGAPSTHAPASLEDAAARLHDCQELLVLERERERATTAQLAVLNAALASTERALDTAIAPHHSLTEALSVLDEHTAAVQSLITSTETLEAAQAAGRRATAALSAALKLAGVESLEAASEALRSADWCERAEQSVREHDNALAVARAQLAGTHALDAPIDLDAAEASVLSATGTAAESSRLAAIARHRGDKLRELMPSLTATLREAQPLHQRRDLARSLADLAGGEGANTYKMRLSTYVLAARLEQVAAAASVKLSTMTAGRFTLSHSDERASRGARSGLGLVVNDAHTGRTRETASLSGGETFMASLSLALGLAEIVEQESGGNPIDALFVDEGFGTLDDQTLDQVMEVLDGLRAGGRLVGVVSHVRELRDRIPARVQVSRSETGSVLEVIGA